MSPSDNDSVVSDGQMSDLSDDSIAELRMTLPQRELSPTDSDYIPTLLEVRPNVYRLRLYTDMVLENPHASRLDLTVITDKTPGTHK
jgi:hypothetical protein